MTVVDDAPARLSSLRACGNSRLRRRQTCELASRGCVSAGLPRTTKRSESSDPVFLVIWRRRSALALARPHHRWGVCGGQGASQPEATNAISHTVQCPQIQRTMCAPDTTHTAPSANITENKAERYNCCFADGCVSAAQHSCDPSLGSIVREGQAPGGGGWKEVEGGQTTQGGGVACDLPTKQKKHSKKDDVLRTKPTRRGEARLSRRTMYYLRWRALQKGVNNNIKYKNFTF